jgi:APA family basic amino acid/polyamine antiporter
MTLLTSKEMGIEGRAAARELGALSATTIVAGSMVGSGIFIVSADISRQVDSPALLLMAWIITAIMTMIGALSYGELAAMMPRAGGQYVYLREAFGPLCGFLYGWTLLLIIQTGTIAAVGMAFGKFFGLFVPAISSQRWLFHLGHIPLVQLGPVAMGNIEVGLNTVNLTAIIVLGILTLVNILGVRQGATLQNVFTAAKILALALLVLVGAVAGRNASAIAANFGQGEASFWRHFSIHATFATGSVNSSGIHWVGVLTILGIVQVGSLFSADAWNNVTFIAGEVRNAKKNLPLALIVGTGTVLTLYLLVNIIYLCVLPLHGNPVAATAIGRGIQYASEDRVATAVLEQIIPSGSAVMAVVILISTFGCANGMILAGARVVQAMSNDGLFFVTAGRINSKFGTPVTALVLQFVWTTALCLSGSYGQLLDYTMFAALLFYILTLAGLIVLRIRRPDAPRPYRALGYPVLPLVYIAMAGWICLTLLRYKPQFTWPGLALVLLGVPVYYFWSRRHGVPGGLEPVEKRH